MPDLQCSPKALPAYSEPPPPFTGLTTNHLFYTSNSACFLPLRELTHTTGTRTDQQEEVVRQGVGSAWLTTLAGKERSTPNGIWGMDDSWHKAAIQLLKSPQGLTSRNILVGENAWLG